MNLSGNEREILTTIHTIDEVTAKRLRVKAHPPGTVVFPKIGGAIATNKRRIIVKPTAIDNNCLGIRPNESCSTAWLFLVLNAIDLSKYQSGTSVPALSQGTLEEIEVSLPPLAEQKRIVAKVEELLALCDELEARQTAAREHRTHLLRSALGHLTAGARPSPGAATPARKTAPDTLGGSDPDHAAFVLREFSSLTTTPEDVPALRQAILSLAVQGRLVPRHPLVSTAKLLPKIYAHKKRLESEGVIKKPKPLPQIEETELDYEIPSHWEWARLGDLCELITDGTHLTPKYTANGKMFLSAQNVKPFRFMPEKHRFVSEADYRGYIKNRKAEVGDILLTRVGAGIGEAAVIDQRLDFAIYVSIALVRPANGFVDPHYITVWLNSPHGTGKSRQFTYGIGMSQGNLNLGQIQKFVVSLPPLAEQHRIVAKVDDLMRWCDELETRLTAAQTTAAALLDASLHEILAG